jgi:hypothetical protein
MKVSEILKQVQNAIGICDQTIVFQRISEALTVLANKNFYQCLTGFVDICSTSDGRQVTLPREIETPLAVNIGGHPTFFRNSWHEFHVNGMGSLTPTDWSYNDNGFFPVFQDMKTASSLIFVADLKTDLAATIQVMGFDQNNQWIRTQNPDGTWSDGLLVPVNLLTDFPNQLPIVDLNRLVARNFYSIPISVLDILSGTNDFASGVLANLSLINNPLPTPLINGGDYFVRNIDSSTISLHTSRSGALTNTDLVTITSADTTSQISLTDRRNVSSRTKFNSASPHNIKSGTLINFTGVALPTPILLEDTFYAGVLDANDFTIHATAQDAINGINILDVTDAGTSVVANANQPLAPITTFNFPVNHDFQQGDAVLVTNSGGSLPTPLISGITYFVRVLSTVSITLHNSVADAANNANPIILTSNGAGANVIVKTIPCSVNLGTLSNVVCANHGLSLNGGDFVQFTTSGTYPAPIIQGTTYVAGTPSDANSFSLQDTSLVPVNITSLGSGQLYLVLSRAFTVGFTNQWQTDASALATQATFKFSTTGVLPSTNPTIDTSTTYYLRDINNSVIEVYDTAAHAADTAIRLTSTRATTSNVATIVTQAAHGFATNDYVEIDGVATTLNGVLASITVSTGGTGWTEGNAVNISDGSSHKAKGTIDVAHGLLQTITITNGGSGWTTTNAFTATDVNNNVATGTVTASAGAITAFTITAHGTGFTVGESLTVTGSGSGGIFTVATIADGVAITKINITNGGNGFTVAGSLTITGAGSGGTYSVATVNNNVSNVFNTYNQKRVQITVTNSTTFTYPATQIDEPTTTDTGGQVTVAKIDVNGLGAGSLFLTLSRPVTAQVRDSFLDIGDPTFLVNGAIIQFETNGTLPSPLTILTNYVLQIQNGLVQVFDTMNNPITISSIGVGTHDFVIARTFGVTLPTSITVASNIYNDGDAVVGITTGSIPLPLVANTTYYVRRIDDNTIELYDSYANAIASPSTIGRQVLTNTGIGNNQLVQSVLNLKFSKITRIFKSTTNGFTNLYAWDTARTNYLTLVGRYYPDETEPNYRRITLGTCCKWVRIKYYQNVFKIKSVDDFLPITNTMALIGAIKSNDLFLTNYSEQAEKYLAAAVTFLEDEETRKRGPESPTAQFNTAIWTNSGDALI